MEDHITLFAVDNYKLAAMGEPLGDGVKVFMLLDLLPKTPIWEVFATSYLQSLPIGQLPTFEATSAQGQSPYSPLPGLMLVRVL